VIAGAAADVDELMAAFDRNGASSWDFNEFVAALKRTDYTEDEDGARQGVAAIGCSEWARRGRSENPPSSAASVSKRPTGEEGGAASLISPGAIERAKIRRDLRGREFVPRASRPHSGAGQRVEHSPSYAAPQVGAWHGLAVHAGHAALSARSPTHSPGGSGRALLRPSPIDTAATRVAWVLLTGLWACVGCARRRERGC
jgi:hypothetical protein